MKQISVMIGLVLITGIAMGQVTHYVDVNSTSPLAPYTSWAQAATNIPDATSIAAENDIIRVADGTYFLGAKVSVSNTTLISVNGAELTIINNPLEAGVYVRGSNALISGFSITGQRTNSIGLALGPGSTMDSCRVYDNTTVGNGDYTTSIAGIYAVGATIKNSLIYSNRAENATIGTNDIIVGGVALVSNSTLTNSSIFSCEAIGTMATNTDWVVGGLLGYRDSSGYYLKSTPRHQR